MTGRLARVSFALICVLPGGVAGARAETPPPPWSDVAELSYVMTAGNAESNTVGFKNTLEHHWGSSAFVIKAEAVRAKSTVKDPVAYGTPDDHVVFDNATTRTSAEYYVLSGRYDHKISDRWVAFLGAGWDRNRPSGIENRYVAEAGAGAIWSDTDTLKFRTNFGLTYTKREDVTEVPGRETKFAGVRLAWEFLYKFSANATYKNTLTLDDSLKSTSDYRGDMVNSLTVAMSKKLALKASLEWIYASKPGFKSVPLFDAPGGTRTGDVLVEAEKLDTIFTTSLVVNF